jgi:hypothetical protein
MLNLIRGKNGLPFSHYDVVNLQSNVLTKVNPSVTAGRTGVTNSIPRTIQTQQTTGGTMAGTVLTTAIGGAGAIAETVTRPWSASLTGENDNTITISVSPVHDEPAVYEAYVAFLNYGNTGHLARSSTGRQPANNKVNLSLQTQTTTVTTQQIVTGQQLRDKNGKLVYDDKGKPVYEPNSLHEVPITETQTVSAPSESKPDLSIRGFWDDVKSVAASLTRPRVDFIPGTVKFWRGYYYWIPTTYVEQFSHLCFALVSRTPSTAGGGAGISGASTSIRNPVKLQQLQNLQLLNLQNSIQSLQ